MPSVFGFLRSDDSTRAHARNYARLIGKYHRAYPDRPLNECMPAWAVGILKKICAEGTFERKRLDAILSPNCPCYDPVEFCCRLVAFHSGVEQERGRAYLKQAECVQEELERVGIYDRSDWLRNLRSLVANEPRAVESGEPDVMLVPRHPNAGNWVGLCVLGAIGFCCLYFHHPTAAMILGLIGVLSFLTPVSYWEIDRGRGKLRMMSRNGLFLGREIMAYPMKDIVSVDLEIRPIEEEATQYKVSVIFAGGEKVVVGNQRRDANRISEYLGLEISTRKM